MLTVTDAALFHSGPPPQIFAAESHAKAIELAFRNHVRPLDCKEGFVLSDGTFAHRVTAMDVAKEAGQVRKEYLTDEVLYGYMLK